MYCLVKNYVLYYSLSHKLHNIMYINVMYFNILYIIIMYYTLHYPMFDIDPYLGTV